MKTAMMMAMVVGVSGLAAATAQAGGCGGCGATEVASAGEKAELATKAVVKVQTTCPVMGGKINKDLYVDQGGKRIYVCCKGCIAPVEKEFRKYAEKVTAAGETVAELQTTCPVMGGKINKKQYVDANGKRIYVCCPGCIGKIKADPDKYIKQLEKDGVTLDTPPDPQAKSDDAHKGHNH